MQVAGETIGKILVIINQLPGNSKVSIMAREPMLLCRTYKGAMITNGFEIYQRFIIASNLWIRRQYRNYIEKCTQSSYDIMNPVKVSTARLSPASRSKRTKSGNRQRAIIPNEGDENNGSTTITENEIREAFSMIDSHGENKVTVALLRSKLQPFMPNLTYKQLKLLMDDKKFLHVDDILDLLKNYTPKDLDATAEAFSLYDPSSSGTMDLKRFKEVYHSCGFGELSADDLNLLVSVMDVDGDGEVSLEDFRRWMKDEGETLPIDMSSFGK
jgi:Ca2+-binding EF-hand superfamily protein